MTKLRRLCALAAVCLFSATWAASAHAQTTALFFDSQSGDYIGQGERRTWTAEDMTFTASVDEARRVVRIAAQTAGFTEWWRLEFAAPGGSLLTTGEYDNATRYPFQTMPSPGLDVSGSGRGCNQLTGRFVVHEIVVTSGGQVVRFAADFEQHCEGGAPALFGAVRFNSTRASLNPFDGAYPEYSLRIEPAVNGYVTGEGIDCGAGRTDCVETFAERSFVTLTAVPQPGYVFLGWAGLDCVGGEMLPLVVARRTFCTPVFNAAPGSGNSESPDLGSGALVIDGPLAAGGLPVVGGRVRQAFITSAPGLPTRSVIRVASATTNQVQFQVIGPRNVELSLTLGAPTGTPLAPGTYAPTAATRVGEVPHLSLTGLSGSCGRAGRFEVHEIVFTNGQLTRFSADFQLPCGTTDVLTVGSVRYQSTRPSLLPFDGSYPAPSIRIMATTGGYVTSPGIDCGDGGRADCQEAYGGATYAWLRATASPGHQFLGWTGDCGDRAPVTAILVRASQLCIATFVPAPGGGATGDPALARAALLIETPTHTPARRIWFGPDVSLSATTSGSSVSITASSLLHGSTYLSFSAPGGRLAPGEYENAMANPQPGSAGLSVSPCFLSQGRFRVHEVTYSPSGALLTLAADFEAFCSSSPNYVAGAVRVDANRRQLLPFDGEYPVFKLTIQPGVGGSVRGAGIDCGPGRGDCAETYAQRVDVPLQAFPEPGYRFLGWTGACEGAQTTTIAVTWSHTCSAVFGSVLPGLRPEDPRLRDNALLIDSRRGDPIGMGEQRIWLDAQISGYSYTPRNGVSLTVRSGERTIYLDFKAPLQQPLTPGVYENASGSFSTLSPAPAIRIGGLGGHCSSSTGLTGRFTIYQFIMMTSTSSTVGAFAADFEVRCTPSSPPISGSIRFRSSRSELRPFPPAASTQGPNDFTGDGFADLLFQNRSDGRLSLWHLEGAAYTASSDLVPERLDDVNWHIVGRGDANRDGRPDIYWQHQTTGALAVWYMFESNRVGAELLTPNSVADTQWKVRTVTDLDRDGHPDLVWQHAGTGDLAVWFMNGATIRSGQPLGPGSVPDLHWAIVGSGDVNQDGSPDLIWHHGGSGNVAVWFMNGRQLLRGEGISPGGVADTNWQVRGVADLDGNGSPDLIWQNTATLQVAAWLMNGLRLIDGRLIDGPTLSSADWYLVGPK